MHVSLILIVIVFRCKCFSTFSESEMVEDPDDSLTDSFAGANLKRVLLYRGSKLALFRRITAQEYFVLSSSGIRVTSPNILPYSRRKTGPSPVFFQFPLYFVFYVNSKCKVLRNGETHTNGHQTHGTDWIGPVTVLVIHVCIDIARYVVSPVCYHRF
jgi:hypothetical protein